MISGKFKISGKVLSVLIMALMIGIGCNRKKEIRGKEFVPKNDLVNVLVDMHLIDAVTNDMMYYHKFNEGDSIDLHTAIFEKYGITREMYERTIEEYSKHPRQLDKIYDEVLMELQLMQDKVEEEMSGR